MRTKLLTLDQYYHDVRHCEQVVIRSLRHSESLMQGALHLAAADSLVIYLEAHQEDNEAAQLTQKNHSAAGDKDKGISTREAALERLDKDFENCPDRMLYKKTRSWVKAFYKQRAQYNKRPSLTSDPYYRRTILGPCDTVIEKYSRGKPWSGDLPSRAALVGSIYLHSLGHCGSKVLGALIAIQRLDVIPIQEMRHTVYTQEQTRYIMNPNHCVADLASKVGDYVQKVGATEELVRQVSQTADDAQVTAAKADGAAQVLTGNVREKRETRYAPPASALIPSRSN
ncbi:hypothetical protein LZ31DRAFT_392752 [Colletotrichum somersetense]|nr:hypothetical protein LZ31DRAFT_392752 [Colletotrichum somersetense]